MSLQVFGFASLFNPHSLATDFDIFEDGECVGNEDGCGVVGGDEVGDNRLFADAHEADGQARL